MSKINEPMPITTEEVNDRLRAAGAEFGLFDRVRHVAQTEGKSGIVTGLLVRDGGRLIYLVAWGPGLPDGEHYGAELELDDGESWNG